MLCYWSGIGILQNACLAEADFLAPYFSWSRSELKLAEVGAQPRFNPNLGLPVAALEAHTP